jgi:hypothetical protein
VPHQVCQFHALRDASKKVFEADKQVKTAMRKRLQPKVRDVRKQIKKHLTTASPPEAAHLAVLDDYATGIVTALNTDGLQPFQYATVETTAMLDEIEASLQRLAKKGACKSAVCAKAGPSASYCGSACCLGRPTGADQTHARLAPGGRAYSGYKPGVARRRKKQCNRWK